MNSNHRLLAQQIAAHISNVMQAEWERAQAHEPAPTTVRHLAAAAAGPDGIETYPVPPDPAGFSVNHKFLVQISVPADRLPCFCKVCRRRQAADLIPLLESLVAQFVDASNPLSASGPPSAYSVTVQREL